jgi:hypothetical protein
MFDLEQTMQSVNVFYKRGDMYLCYYCYLSQLDIVARLEIINYVVFKNQLTLHTRTWAVYFSPDAWKWIFAYTKNTQTE